MKRQECKKITIGIGIGKDSLERHFGLARQIYQVATSALVLDASQVLVTRRADYVEYVIQLIEIVFAWKQWLVVEHLGQNAADAPHVDRFVVALRVEHDLGRAVPTRRHVLGEETRVIVIGIGDACKSEIANL